MPAQQNPTFFAMLTGSSEATLAHAVSLLKGGDVEVLWAGAGDALIEPTRLVQPHAGQYSGLSLVIRCKEEAVRALKQGAGLKHVYVVETEETKWQPTKKQMEQSEIMAPDNEPLGVKKMLSEDWWKLLTLANLLRNIRRVATIILWGLYHILWARDMSANFDMINLMRFENKRGGATYELYRDQAGKLVMARGGKMGYLGNIKGGKEDMHELMIVKYKTRWQFLRMALATPSYWPLAMLRDEALQDSLLHASKPLDLT